MKLHSRTICPSFFTSDRVKNEQEVVNHWIKAPNEVSGRKLIQIRLPRTSKSIYGSLQKELGFFFHGKCAFCETRITGDEKAEQFGNFKDIELLYFRPVSISKDATPNYIWLCWQWANMYAACKECYSNYNQPDHRTFPILGKRANEGVFSIQELNTIEEPVYLDPCFDEVENFFKYQWSDDRKLMSMVGVDENNRGKQTIKAFNLNRKSLAEARGESAAKFEEFLAKLRIKIDLNLNEACQNVIEKFSENTPFLGMKRQIFQSWLSQQDLSLEIQAVFNLQKENIFELSDVPICPPVSVELNPSGLMIKRVEKYVDNEIDSENREDDTELQSVNYDTRKLREQIYNHLDVAEFRVMCFDLDVPFHDLDEGGYNIKTVSFVVFARQNGKVDEVVNYLNEKRGPDYGWGLNVT